MDYRFLKEIVKDAKKIVFFGGAGVSKGSGIPDFRGTGGLYNNPEPLLDVPPETALSAGYLRRHPERFFEFYRQKMVYPYARPNEAHYALAALEEMGKLSAVITQNIDGLHQAAGSRNVIELHGSAQRTYCMRCGARYGAEHVLSAEGVPLCSQCAGIVRPDIVLYDEALDAERMLRAESAVYECDTLIIGGTSLTVYPAASLVDYFEGEHLIIINRNPTPYDGVAEYVFRADIAALLERAVKNIVN